MKDMTKGNPLKIIFLFSLPILFGNIFQQFYNMADTIMVGRILGVDALAAMGTTAPLFGLVMSLSIGLVMGFSIQVAQSYGAQNHAQMRQAIANMLVLSLGCAVVITICFLCFMNPLLQLLDTPQEIIGMSRTYLMILFAGTLITVLYNFAACVLRAVGDSKTPLYFLIFSSLLNIALDYLFIANFSMGIGGAAIATLIAQAVSLILCIFYMLHSYQFLIPKKADCIFQKEMVQNQLGMGISMALMSSIVSIGSVVLQSAVNSLGATTIAGHTAARKISEVFMQPIASLGMAATTFASQNYGAKQFARIREGVKQTVILGAIVSLLVLLVSWTCIDRIIALFVDASQIEVVDIAAFYLRINSIFYLALVIVITYRNVLQGFGQKKIPIFTSILEMLVKLGATFTLAPLLGYGGIAIAEPIAWVLMAIFLYVGYHRYTKSLLLESESIQVDEVHMREAVVE